MNKLQGLFPSAKPLIPGYATLNLKEQWESAVQGMQLSTEANRHRDSGVRGRREEVQGQDDSVSVWRSSSTRVSQQHKGFMAPERERV